MARNKWSFQLLPNTRDLLGTGYRIDEVGQAVENEVNEALPYYFRFHKIGKLVIGLGPNQKEKDYVELLNVAQKQCPGFDLLRYRDSDRSEKERMLKRTIYEVFDWLTAHFDDADCFRTAKEKLNWNID